MVVWLLGYKIRSLGLAMEYGVNRWIGVESLLLFPASRSWAGALFLSLHCKKSHSWFSADHKSIRVGTCSTTGKRHVKRHETSIRWNTSGSMDPSLACIHKEPHHHCIMSEYNARYLGARYLGTIFLGSIFSAST